ncbi:ECF-type sigma factor [Dokdonella sp.]|uniref:ECF-type sigma factor n=1 Tax=Dokdonella sp. TaxID=2291710 RepID=UPI001B1AD4A2|nr:ECF-type sigma factor [Dokdonella sp.]MBO9662946.1 sigma-70 family RNA polymerase sigma factor [Dokdonella sp.]
MTDAAFPQAAARAPASEITLLLEAVHGGDRDALAQVFGQLYAELRQIARTRVANNPRTLTPTVLVHEAFVRLIRARQLDLRDRRHFFACAARAMHAVAVDHLRRRTADKRNGGDAAQPLDDVPVPAPDAGLDLLGIDHALRRLDAISPRQREIVELRFFGGFEFEEIAEIVGCSLRTAKRDWERARAFLHAQLGENPPAPAGLSP